VIKGFITAICTLTVIPVPGNEDKEMSLALPWFPLAGLLLGIILYFAVLIWKILPFPHWPAGCGMLLLILDVLLTRGLHLDGLADWADSFGGFGKGKRLAIMKDVSMGAFGALALILTMMTRWVLFVRLLSSGTFLWIMAIMVISRSMLVELMTTMPYARSSDGMARPFMDKAGKRHRLLSHMITLVLCLMFGPIGMGLFLLAWVIAIILRIYFRRQFNGITGDILGAANVIIEIVLLTACAVPGNYISGYAGWIWVF
jgi:adenosylcobinamide-GDP ribazoletransferase